MSNKNYVQSHVRDIFNYVGAVRGRRANLYIIQAKKNQNDVFVDVAEYETDTKNILYLNGAARFDRMVKEMIVMLSEEK